MTRTADSSYDRAVILGEDGAAARTLSRRQYESLSVKERCVLLMSQRVQFYAGAVPVPPKAAVRAALGSVE